MANYDYDMLVIGSGPAGQRAAIQAAKLDKRVAIVERKATVSGVAVNVGNIPSKTRREAVLYLSGYRERGLYGDAYVVKRDVRLADLLVRTDYVTRHEVDVTLNQILRNRVELLAAEASFIDPHSLHLIYSDGSEGEFKLYGRGLEVRDPEKRRLYGEALYEKIGIKPEEPEFHLFAVDIESAAYAVIRDEEWFRRIWNAAGRG